MGWKEPGGKESWKTEDGWALSPGRRGAEGLAFKHRGL